MQIKFAVLSLMLPLLSFAQSNFEKLQNLKEIKRLAFGSCNDQKDDQPLWEDLIRQKPDLWLWGGDNVYADWMAGRNILNAYQFQNKHPRYHLFKRLTPILGIWDDHDYAYNNATGYFEHKKESQQMALDFFEVPENSPLRTQEGLYSSHDFGKVKIILLDNRYFKNLDPEYPMLGKVQWDWLERELATSSAKVHFIMSGLSIFSPLIPYTEEWAETNELSRMKELLKRLQPKGVVFLSGDKHFSSIFQRHGQLEFMSSGMTHQADRRTWPYLSRKFSKTYFGLSYGQIDISWDNDIPILTMSMRSKTGKDIHKTTFKWMEKKWAEITPPN